MLTPRRCDDVSEVMRIGFETESCSESSNFALKAATEALSRALDKPKAEPRAQDMALLASLCPSICYAYIYTVQKQKNMLNKISFEFVEHMIHFYK